MYGDLSQPGAVDRVHSRAILTPKNMDVDELNATATELFPGEVSAVLTSLQQTLARTSCAPSKRFGCNVQAREFFSADEAGEMQCRCPLSSCTRSRSATSRRTGSSSRWACP